MPRPFRIRTPKVSKKSGPTVFTCSTPSSGDENVTPGIEIGLPSSLRAEGRYGGECRVLDAGQRLELLQDLAVNRAQAVTLDVGPVSVDRQHEHAVGDEAQRLRLQVAQADREQCGRHDQDRRQRDLHDDERP